jgi:hypothetical protein
MDLTQQELHGTRRWGTIIPEFDFTLEVRLALQKFVDAKPPLSQGKDVHAAVVELVHNVFDARTGAVLEQLPLVRQNYPELFASSQAIRNHRLVARLKNVERQRLVGKQNDVEGKQRDRGGLFHDVVQYTKKKAL